MCMSALQRMGPLPGSGRFAPQMARVELRITR